MHIAIENEDTAPQVLAALKDKGIPIEEHRKIAPSLEDVFIAMVASQEADKPASQQAV